MIPPLVVFWHLLLGHKVSRSAHTITGSQVWLCHTCERYWW